MSHIGYEWVCQQLKLRVFPLRRPASVGPVSRLTVEGNALRVPASVAPQDDSLLEHLLLAVKHECINLQVLAQCLPKLPADEMLAAVMAQPSGRYVRVLGFLWETFSQQLLAEQLPVAGPTVAVFEPKRYICGPDQRCARWRVNFNGLGHVGYCVTVERTPEITELLEQNILEKANAFACGLSQQTLDRAMSWAYLHETQSSFAIEHEQPLQDKAQAFVQLLRQAHEPRLLDESYLVALQNLCITNPLDKAVFYRHQQNWLQGPLRGAMGVTYVPPVPAQVGPLMEELLQLANHWHGKVDPLVAASVLSFAFVFIHPFMDGNGRLSRFLYHYMLAQSGQLRKGLLLPVSVAMQRNEDDYLQALQSFSVPMREYWQVNWLGDEDYTFDLLSEHSLYRYWDASECVLFGLRMAQQALEQDLFEETRFLQAFDRVYRAIDQRFDVRGKDLSVLVIGALQNQGKVSNNRRRQFQDTVQPQVFDAIEEQIFEQQESIG